MRNGLVLALCLTMMVGAQTLWKIGLGKLGKLDMGRDQLLQLWNLARTWEIVVGVMIFGVTTLLWLDLLSRFPLSQLYPMMSLVYVIAFFVGWWQFGEEPSLIRFVGIAVICLGVALVARSGG